MQLKYEKERSLYEEEKQKRLYEIQDSIENLNLAASDKSKLKNEIDELIAEQNKLQSKVNQLVLNKEDEENKNRQLEREINELNIQLNANRVTSNRYSAEDEND